MHGELRIAVGPVSLYYETEMMEYFFLMIYGIIMNARKHQ